MEESEPCVPPSHNKCPCIQLRRNYQSSVDLALGQILNHRTGEREGLVGKVLRKWQAVPNYLLTTKVLKGPTPRMLLFTNTGA